MVLCPSGGILALGAESREIDVKTGSCEASKDFHLVFDLFVIYLHF